MTKILGKGNQISIRFLLAQCNGYWSKWMSQKEFTQRVKQKDFPELVALEIRETITRKEAIEKYGYKP